jgi:hypothetical protein
MLNPVFKPLQLCYLARTWFGDTLGMVVFGNSEPATVGGFGDDATTASCRFVFRSSSEHVVAEIKAEAQVRGRLLVIT